MDIQDGVRAIRWDGVKEKTSSQLIIQGRFWA
jgi:hypothetical protein